MDSSLLFQYISVFCEVIAMCAGIALAVFKKKIYGWLIALTFALYICFDLARMHTLGIPQELPSFLFLIASIAIVVAIVLIYRET